MSMHILENAALRITVADAGAQLSGVWDKEAGAERLWTADPAVWNQHAPILFPFVGKLTDGKYRVGGKEYPMATRHGFARDKVFTCTGETADCVEHVLAATDETRAVYPYDFRLSVRHSLDVENPRRLRVAWTVENTGGETMYFSIGGHPAFLLPAGVRKEDCYVFFPGREVLSYFNASDAGFAMTQAPHLLGLDRGFAHYRADVPDTWIFEDQDIASVGIALPDKKPYVLMNCAGFPMLAVWANPKGPFICLEPWYGRTDDEGFTGSLPEKKGIQTLEAGGKREYVYTMDFC